MITQQGKEYLERELQTLKKELLRTVEERGKAASEGDLKENSAYIFLTERATVLSTQISQLEDELKTEKIAIPPVQSHTISFGHQVSLRFENDKREMTITFVGRFDARIKPDLISIDSPLGIALTGKHIGDKVTVNDQPVTVLDIKVGEI